jgi:hypothetical protein
MPLNVSDGPEAFIHDFVHSSDPRFKGKSKKTRIKQALAAYYSKKRGESLTSLSSPVSSILRELIGAVGTNPTTDLGNIANKSSTTATNVTSSEPPSGLRQPSLSGQHQTGDVGPNNLNRPSLTPSLDQASPSVNPATTTPQSSLTPTTMPPSSLTTGASNLLGTTGIQNQMSPPDTTGTGPSDMNKSPRELSNMLAKNGGSQL